MKRLLLCLASLPVAAFALTPEVNPATIHVGDAFTVSIEGNPTTGYIWTKDTTDTLKHLCQSYDPSTNKIVGAPGVRVFTFRSTKPGTFKLNFSKARSWEAAPVD